MLLLLDVRAGRSLPTLIVRESPEEKPLCRASSSTSHIYAVMTQEYVKVLKS